MAWARYIDCTLPGSWSPSTSRPGRPRPGFHLPPGVHTVTFYSDENGLTRYEQVVIEPDKVVKLDEDMQR